MRGNRVRFRHRYRGSGDQRESCLVTALLWIFVMTVAVGAAALFVLLVMYLMTEWN